MHDEEHLRALPGLAAEDAMYVIRGYDADAIGQDDGVTGRGCLRVACQPVQNGDADRDG